MRTLFDIRRELDQLREKRRKTKADLLALDDGAGNGALDPGEQQRWSNLIKGVERFDQDIERAEAEYGDAMLEGIRSGSLATEGAEFGNGQDRDRAYDPDRSLAPAVRAARDQALRTIERYTGEELAPAAGEQLERVLRKADPAGIMARYLAAVGDPAYEAAFGKMLAHPTDAHLRMAPAEIEAVRRVSQVMQERGMVEGTGSAGGFAVPFALDPSILLTSSGTINPLRSIAKVTPIATNEWRGVASEGVTAAFAAEATEVGDGTPTLAQPVLKAHKAHAFIPFSIELEQDWASLRQELFALLQDAKDQLEADKFVNGAGDASDEPEGLISGLVAGSLVQSAGIGAFAVDDVYALQQGVPPRFRANASWVADGDILNVIYRFVGTGDPNEPPIMAADGRVLRRPTFEASPMASAVAAGNKILLYGDVAAAYRIVDRIGLSVELVSHLFGANRRPSGERGVYAFWRVGAGVLVDNAVRVLQVRTV